MSDDEKKKDIVKRGRDYSLFRFYETLPAPLPIPSPFHSVSVDTIAPIECLSEETIDCTKRDRIGIQCSISTSNRKKV